MDNIYEIGCSALFTSCPVFQQNANMPPDYKYARIERERRFLLDKFPGHSIAARIRRITDFYIDGTRLRLREMKDDPGSTVFKLTQKVSEPGNGAQQGFITTIYLTEQEFRILARLPAKKLDKIRYSVPPFAIDVFQGDLEGLLLAEAEFDSGVESENLPLPSFILHEVSSDERFTGGRLVDASPEDVQDWLREYGISLKAHK